MLKGRRRPGAAAHSLGMDDALWAATRNKKGLLQLLRKGKTEFLESRIQNLQEIIDDAPAATRVTQATQAAQEALAASPAPAPTAPPRAVPPPPAAPGKSLQEVAKELAAAQMPEELRPYGMDEPLWLEVKDKRSLIKLLRRREFDFLEARITTLRAKFAEDGIELAPVPPPAASAPAAAAAAGAESEEWFEEGAEEAELKRRFKELARRMHPDRAGRDPVRARELEAEFQELQAEYERLLAQCKTYAQRERLRKGWLALGGLAAAVTLASPLAAAAAAAGAAVSLARGAAGGADGGADGAAPAPVPVPWDALDDTHELYVRLDAAVEAEDYDEAARIKERIDALLNTGPQLWSIKDGR